jgi:hypothetical protein
MFIISWFLFIGAKEGTNMVPSPYPTLELCQLAGKTQFTNIYQHAAEGQINLNWVCIPDAESLKK